MTATRRSPATRSKPSGEADLDTRAKIHDVVVDFYREVVFDDLLGPVFDEVADVDWATHLPKLVDYWCQVLLGQPGYDGYILGPHAHVHEKGPFTAELFDRWYSLWASCVDTHWTGPIADRATSHAERIGRVLARRLIDIEWSAPPRSPGGPLRTSEGAG
ncbi:MAG: group III truncated hemoglobin [Acidimicrobiales bacterium]|nr:group III truncated hemoglobin [Acidimicrobiales bacterium]